MDRAIFISDIHLSENEAGISRLFFDFLESRASKASSLFILGDLFDVWAGDDDLPDPFNSRVVSALKKLSDSGVSLQIMRGNRDFLMGPGFFEAAGAVLLPDPSVVEISGERFLLTHGDSLCTADNEYLEFRSKVRDPAWQSDFLAQPLAARKEVISALRRKSEEKKQEKSAQIMDVDPDAVREMLLAHDCSRMIHGHTHKPGRHAHSTACERWVLGDWHEEGAVCLYAENGAVGFFDARE